MWRTWMTFEPQRVLVGLHVYLAVLAFTIHFILLSTDTYNWMDGPNARSTIEMAASE